MQLEHERGNLVVPGHEGKCRTWDAASSELLHRLSRHTGRVEYAAEKEVGYVKGVAGVARFIERWTRPDEEGMPMQR